MYHVTPAHVTQAALGFENNHTIVPSLLQEPLLGRNVTAVSDQRNSNWYSMALTAKFNRSPSSPLSVQTVSLESEQLYRMSQWEPTSL